MALDLQTQLSRIQEWIPKVVPGAEHQDISPAHRAVLEQVVFILTWCWIFLVYTESRCTKVSKFTVWSRNTCSESSESKQVGLTEPHSVLQHVTGDKWFTYDSLRVLVSNWLWSFNSCPDRHLDDFTDCNTNWPSCKTHLYKQICSSGTYEWFKRTCHRFSSIQNFLWGINKIHELQTRRTSHVQIACQLNLARRKQKVFPEILNEMNEMTRSQYLHPVFHVNTQQTPKWVTIGAD